MKNKPRRRMYAYPTTREIQRIKGRLKLTRLSARLNSLEDKRDRAEFYCSIAPLAILIIAIAVCVLINEFS